MTHQLPLDTLIEEQHAVLILLQAMYPLEAELHLPPLTLEFLESPSVPTPEIRVDLTLSPDGSEGTSTTLEILLSLKLDKTRVEINLGPSSLPRIEHEKMRDLIRPIEVDVGSSEYIFDVIRIVEEYVINLDLLSAQAKIDGIDVVKDKRIERLERIWFWFPSLSSREKRKDLVTFAHDAGLTGFVLAGKPGLLCVEGDGGEIDNYMGRIKSESWSDIPSYQKKVTERLRNPLSSLTSRLLPRMIDITDQISHYGQYAHRPEMGEVKKQMEKWGVEAEWGQVIMGPGGGGGGG